jgi:hypothetical protein
MRNRSEITRADLKRMIEVECKDLVMLIEDDRMLAAAIRANNIRSLINIYNEKD